MQVLVLVLEQTESFGYRQHFAQKQYIQYLHNKPSQHSHVTFQFGRKAESHKPFPQRLQPFQRNVNPRIDHPGKEMLYQSFAQF